MNRTSRTDELYGGEGLNQSPNALSNDLTTNADLNGIANARELQREVPEGTKSPGPPIPELEVISEPLTTAQDGHPGANAAACAIGPSKVEASADLRETTAATTASTGPSSGSKKPLGKITHAIVTFGKFVGPGFLISVAYIDPGNYATDIAAGASYRFRLLFIVLMSNIFAIFLQSLSIKLGTVTGLNLAEACRAFLPRWLNYALYAMAELAIIATDIAEVIGTAIALNLLIPQLPLVGGCAISILDVMLILLLYRPNGPMRGLRLFEFFVMLLVLGVVVCFCVQLSLIQNTAVGEVFQGYLPSRYLVEQEGLFQACGILGATVMPHSLYLGSGIVQSRLKEYDTQCGLMPPETPRVAPQVLSSGVSNNSALDDVDTGKEPKTYYIPSLAAIKHCLKYSYAEIAISLFTFALFVNSAILIVAGASLYSNPDALNADIFGIHDLLSASLSPAAGQVFALALLFSGVSAGIVCTISGQMVSEGALHWHLKPWVRRLVTRSISITPSILIAGAAGREKLDAALNGSQVALSIILPFVSAPLIWFTCFNKYMSVRPGPARIEQEGSGGFGPRGGRGDAEGVEELGDPAGQTVVKMANSWWVSVLAVLVWLVIVCMNVANLVLLGLGES